MGRRIAATTVAIGSLAAPAAALGAGTWSKPTSISPGFAEDATIAGNERGDAVVAYSGAHAAHASIRRAHGPFGAPVKLASLRRGRVRVFGAGMDRDGNAFVGMIETPYHDTFYRPDCCLVRVAIVRRGVPFQVETISTPGEYVSYPRMKMGRDGTAVVRWSAGDLALQSIGRPATGFAQPQVVGRASGQGLLAVDGQGRPLLFGVRHRAGRDTFWARDGDRQGRFAPHYRLHRDSGADAVQLGSPVGFEPVRGGGVATWVGRAVAKPGCCEYEQRLHALSWRRGGSEVVKQDVVSSEYPLAPTLATGPRGRAMIAFGARDVNGSGEFGVHLFVRGRDRLFRGVPGVAGYPLCCDSVPSVAVAVNRHGGAVLAWDGGSAEEPRPGSSAVVRSADGSYGPFGHWSGHLAAYRPGSFDDAPTPVVAIDSTGRATVLMRGDRLYAVDYEPGG
jgi:hypothetical protein